MPALQALKDLTSQLSSAGTAEDIGFALVSVANRFRLTSVLILDTTKLFTNVKPALVFSTAGRAASNSSIKGCRSSCIRSLFAPGCPRSRS